MAETYPNRPPFFANKFIRKLTKTVVANELGADVCWLLTVIAVQEDACGYRKPISFHNAQLMLVGGIGSVRQLDRIRRAAVGRGWLHYVPGTRHAPAYYWVKVPPQFEGLDDGATSEQGGECDAGGAGVGGQTVARRGSDGGSSVVGASSDGATFFPIPNPIPSSAPRSRRKTAGEKTRKPRPRDPLFDAVAEATGSDPHVAGSHVAKVRHLLAGADPPYTPDEVRAFAARLAEFCPWAREQGRTRPTLGELEKHIGRVRAAAPPRPATRYWTPPTDETLFPPQAANPEGDARAD